MSAKSTRLRPDILPQLERHLGERLLRPSDGQYDEARNVWNGMIDRRPAAIARCVTPSEVAACVNVARNNGLLLAVRGGGHSIPGLSVCDDGLMIDLSLMKRIDVDPGDLLADVEPGVTLGELDRATQIHGLATPAGAISHTGVAGLTLGGGVGWLMRKFGLTCDNLMGADVVSAAGNVLTVSEDENPDLLWGLRGGGGNFGIVTRFRYRLHPVGPTVLSGFCLYSGDAAEEVLRFYRDFVADVPDELTSFAGFFTCPDGPEFPERLHGRPVVGLLVCWCGPLGRGEQILRPLRAYGPPRVDLIGPTAFTTLQSMQDETFAWGRRYYNKNNFLPDLTDAAIAAVVAQSERVASPRSVAVVMHCGGEVSRVAQSDTAFANRDARFLIDVTSVWEDPAEDAAQISWVRQFSEAMTPFGSGTYGNTMSEGSVASVYGANHERLVVLKNEYDPGNLFRLNHNIVPTALST